MSTFILGTLLGLVIGLLVCYWQKISTLYQNKDKISAVSGLVSAFSS